MARLDRAPNHLKKYMSTMVELPDDVMREVESQAEPVPSQPVARLDKDVRTGLPVFRCNPDAPARTMTVEQLLALEQDALLSEDLSRAGLLIDTSVWVALAFDAHPRHDDAVAAFGQLTPAEPAIF